jgi:hypothetical protein
MRYVRALSEAGFAPIALSAPRNRRKLVRLGAETKLLAPRQRLPLLISTGTAIERSAQAAHLRNRPKCRSHSTGRDPRRITVSDLPRNRSVGPASVQRYSSSKSRNRRCHACCVHTGSRRGSNRTMTSRFANPSHLSRTGCKTCALLFHSVLGGSHGGRLPCHRGCRRQQ